MHTLESQILIVEAEVLKLFCVCAGVGAGADVGTDGTSAGVGRGDVGADGAGVGAVADGAGVGAGGVGADGAGVGAWDGADGAGAVYGANGADSFWQDPSLQHRLV